MVTPKNKLVRFLKIEQDKSSDSSGNLVYIDQEWILKECSSFVQGFRIEELLQRWFRLVRNLISRKKMGPVWDRRALSRQTIELKG